MARGRLIIVLAAAIAAPLVAASAGSAAEGTTTGTLAAGGVAVESFRASATGPVALRVEWENTSAKLTATLLRRGADGVYRRVAAATGAEMPQLIVFSASPGSYRVRIAAVRGSTPYQSWLRYPTAAPPTPSPGHLTVQFGRSMIGAVTSSCALRPGAVSLLSVASLLQQRGIAATSNATVDLVGTCGGSIGYASWGQLQTLRDTYGWTLTSRGVTGRDLTGLSAEEQTAETCGSLQAFVDHGFTRAWGLFSYAGGDPVADAQTGAVNRCFSYGRDYEPLSNAYPVAAPYIVYVNDVIGGRCHNPTLACYGMPIKNARWYMPRQLLLAYANAGLDGTGRWDILQFYRMVGGHAGTTSSTTPAWSCDAPDPRDHWTNQPELYCLNDMLWVLDRVDPSISYTDPAAMGAAQGRDFTPATG
ncbi:MAG TPA: hypothetical protein VGC71_09550 [Gaiellales bacterium]